MNVVAVADKGKVEQGEFAWIAKPYGAKSFKKSGRQRG